MAYGLNIYAPNGSLSFSSDDAGCYFVSEKLRAVARGTVSTYYDGNVKKWAVPSICYGNQIPLTFITLPIGGIMYAYDQFGCDGGANDFKSISGVGRFLKYTSIYINTKEAPYIVNCINTNNLADLEILPSISGYGIQIFSSTNKLILDSQVEILNILASVQTTSLTPKITVKVPSLMIDGVLGTPYFAVNLLGRMDESSTNLYCHKVYRSSENTFEVSKWKWFTSSVSSSGPIYTAGVNNGIGMTGTIPFARF